MYQREKSKKAIALFSRVFLIKKKRSQIKDDPWKTAMAVIENVVEYTVNKSSRLPLKQLTRHSCLYSKFWLIESISYSIFWKIFFVFRQSLHSWKAAKAKQIRANLFDPSSLAAITRTLSFERKKISVA